MKYLINNKPFKSKGEITSYCRDLIARNKEKILTGEDLEFMLSILSYHKNKNKLEGHSYIKVDIDILNKNYCLWIYKFKSGIELRNDISWTSCVANIPVASDIKIDYTFKFGKYKDKSIYDIDDKKYLEWIVSCDNLFRGDKILINQYLKYGYIPYNPVFWSKSKSKLSK